MRAYPKKELHEALYRELKRLGYATGGLPKKGHPVVDIDQMSLSGEFGDKTAESYEVTFILDVLTREKSQLKAYEVVADIRENMSLEVQGYTVQPTQIYEECLSVQDIDEEGELQRETQRCRVILTKQ